MYKKITKEEIEKLKIGDTIAWYPIVGIPTDAIDLNDLKNIQLLRLGKINDKHIDLEFSVPDNAQLALMNVSMGALTKRKKAIVDENKWWVLSY